MPSERLDDDLVRDPEKWLLREQAQAMLDLFAEDCGRTPVTLEEVREWAMGQDEKHLRDRVNRRLNVAPDAYENLPDSGAVPSAAK
jgi:hypothetical protein